MSLVENYGQPWLEQSEFPDHHDPHRCGTAPFVPVVDTPRQHSCGSYPRGFQANGCNVFRPNYPDDLYLQTHGCKGLADCRDGVPPTGDMAEEGTRVSSSSTPPQWWSATGYAVPSRVGASCAATREGFFGGLVSDDIIAKLLWAGVVWLIIKYATAKK